MGLPKIIYLAPQRFFFVAKDIEGLSATHRVYASMFQHGGTGLLPFDLLFQACFLLLARLRGARQVIAHFAGYHTVVPVLFGFRTHIIVAGSDACSFPGINYGSFRKPLMRWAMSLSMRGATTILPVHSSLERFSNTYSDLGPTEQGYAHFVNDLRTPSITIEYGFDTSSWTLGATPRDAHSVLCVAFGAGPDNAVHFRKGIDLIIAAARALPNHRFTLVGLADANAYGQTPSNVVREGKVPPARLRELLSQSNIYLQPSVMEGFPNALCEAMLCGCLPIVSNITSMPSIVGDAGIVVNKRDADDLVRAILALAATPTDQMPTRRQHARDRVVHFDMRRRMDALGQVLQGNHQGLRDHNSRSTARK